MNISELYTKYEIKPAEYMPNESSDDFGRRVMSSSPNIVEQKGVMYSTGSKLSENTQNQKNSNTYQMYTY
ncbi:hypothetical protein [Sodalis sp. RH20]|uniref:hypothetical protein n=1 Tax=unclassified Sodalis (in: enterobacteria) TaxID=2636512 RepID=UPI0039B65A6C